MNSNTKREQAEVRFRRSGRWLYTLLIAMFPVALLSGKLADHLRNDLVIGVALAILMLLFLFTCIYRVVAYWVFTGNYPFYWLRRK